MTDARGVAFDVIRAVSTSDAYANLLLPTRLRRAKLGPADTALATELAYGTLRASGYYDLVIADAARRAASAIDSAVLDLLRLGAHQLLATRIPPHAAVNETVALARSHGLSRAAGFVNAVMRRISERTPDEWRAAVAASFADPEDARAAVAAHPRWIVDAFRAALAAEGASGEGTAGEVDDLLAADNATPRVNYAVVPFGAETAEGLLPDRYSPIGFTGDVQMRGRVRVQDEGSQLAALALVHARPITAGERWLDLCAGPGGKAVVLGAYAAHAGAALVANEVVPARAGLVRKALDTAGLSTVEVTERDGRSFASEAGQYDRILLDAPCTGLGALRRRPEARWRKTPHDLEGLLPLQAGLLDAAVAALTPGGILAYVTCSPHLAETREQVDAALGRHPSLRALDTPAALDGFTREPLALSSGTHAQLWPHRHGTDAMFVQLLAKDA